MVNTTLIWIGAALLALPAIGISITIFIHPFINLAVALLLIGLGLRSKR